MYFIFTTDIHGTIYSHHYLDNSLSLNSLSRISTVLKQYLEKEVVLIDNGDVLQGSPLTTYNNRYQNHSIMAKAFNHLNYDYFNLGNHDFNYGQTILERYLNEQQATCLTSNVRINNQPIGSSQIYTNKEGIKFGLIGVVTDYIPNWEKPENIENIEVFNVFDTVKKEVDSFKKSVDHIIIVYHGGFEKDLLTGQPTETLTGENVGYQLTSIEGIDVIISGHQHRSFIQEVNGVLCLQCAHNGIEVMELEYKNNQFYGKLIQTNDFEPDKTYESLFDEDEQQTQLWLDTKIGSGPDMRINHVFEAQLNKPLFTTFINHVIKDYFQADFAFSSLFNNSPGLKPEISMRDLVASYPFPNNLVLIEIDKPTLIEYLEQNASYFTLVNGSITIDPKFTTPKLEMYNYDMGDGLSYTIDVSKPVGQRITNLQIPNKDLFTMVINNYRSSGGGNFTMIKDCKIIKEDPNEVIDLLYNYIQEHSPLNVEPVHNIKVIASL